MKQDDYVKNLLNKNSNPEKFKRPKDAINDSANILNDHLLMTKNELSKCLGNIFEETTSHNVKIREGGAENNASHSDYKSEENPENLISHKTFKANKFKNYDIF